MTRKCDIAANQLLRMHPTFNNSLIMSVTDLQCQSWLLMHGVCGYRHQGLWHLLQQWVVEANYFTIWLWHLYTYISVVQKENLKHSNLRVETLSLTSICSAIQPSSRAMFPAIRRAKHFLPSKELPPYPLPNDFTLRSSGKCASSTFSGLHGQWLITFSTQCSIC